MRGLGLAIVGLGVGACFDGGDATGLPCTEDAQCGAGIACMDGVCGGAASTGATDTLTPSSSSGPSTTITTSASESSTTTTPPGPADTSSSGTTAESSSTGETTTCAPPPLPQCGLQRPRSDRSNFDVDIVASTEGAMNPVTRPSSVVTGDFDGDARPDLALTDFETYRLHIFFNDVNIGWDEFPEPPLAAGDLAVPYDLVATDLDCEGGTDFVVSTGGTALVVRAFDDGFATADPLLARPLGFSLAVGDLVADDAHYPDVVLGAGPPKDDGVQLFVNEAGGLSPGEATGIDVNEAWETVILETEDGPLVLVAEGRNYAGPPNDTVRVLRVIDDGGTPVLVAPPALALPEDFDSPWAIAIGNFVGDDAFEVAIGERHVDATEENTSTDGTVRIFAYRGMGEDPVWEELTDSGTTLTVGPGLNAMAAADLDCDGYDDIVVGRNGDSEAVDGAGSYPAVLYGAAEVGGIETIGLQLTSPMAAGSRIAVADFDLDGALEVAIADFGFNVAGARIVILGLDE